MAFGSSLRHRGEHSHVVGANARLGSRALPFPQPLASLGTGQVASAAESLILRMQNQWLLGQDLVLKEGAGAHSLDGGP